MTCSQCRGIETFFDDATARRELRRYRRRGPGRTTRILLEGLAAEGVEGGSVLDVGGGVGAVHHELLDRGAGSAVHVDASPAYLEVARDEAARRGHDGAVRFVPGDFVEVGRRGEVDAADLVALDRVVCCYPDMEALVDETATRARRAYGLVLPRVNVFSRLGFRLVNLVQRLRGHPFHVFLHDPEAVAERVRRHGLRRKSWRRTLLWNVLVFVRPDG